MKPNRLTIYPIALSLIIFFFSTAVAFAQPAPQTMEWKIDGETRKALVYIPKGAKANKTPIVFAFHGHGGTMENMYKTRRFDQLWPEAIFICPQGLNTPGQLTDPEGKRSGWQNVEGKMDDRDLRLFDAMLQSLTDNYKIDQNRIYATGHSNGGGFTYLLWAVRGNRLAAVAPTATASGKTLRLLKPKPVLHLYGEQDTLVKTAWQEATCKVLLKINSCDTLNGLKLNEQATLYPSATKNPVVIFRHPGGHNYPREANQVIVDFLRQQYLR